tara:strand:- start:2125 stop:2274 length:150 start_codon:yes stop_codon:yes gene_type:complete
MKIKAKGYSLTEAIKIMGISLSTYRRWEKPSNRFNDVLTAWVDNLEVKK